MNSYVFDTAAIATFRVDAESADDARRILMLCDGIEYDTDQTKVGFSSDRDEVDGDARLSCVSVRTIVALNEATDEHGNPIATCERPDDGALLADPEAEPLRAAVAAWEKAADGPSGDEEHDAALDLADAVTRIVTSTAWEEQVRDLT